MNDAPAIFSEGAGAAVPASVPSASAPTPAPAGPVQHWIPEKFHVKGADGTLDVDASGRKLADSYLAAQRRLSTGPLGKPAPFEGDYDLSKLSAFGMEPEDAQAAFGDFLDGAKKVGMTQEMIDYALNAYLPHAQSLVAGAKELDQQAMESALRQTWKTEHDYKQNMDNADGAVRAMASAAGMSADDAFRAVGNNPALVRMLASIGAEFREGEAPNVGAGGGGGMSVEQLMRHPAYTDPSHPQHAQVSAAISEYYNQKTGGR